MQKKNKKEKNKTKDSTIKHHNGLNRNQIAVGGWQRFMAISASFEEFLELPQYINAVYTTSCYVSF